MGQVFIFIILDKLEKHAQSPFALIKDHVLLPQASMLQEADALFKTILTPETLQAIVNHSSGMVGLARYRRKS
jgi:uncharacterized UPF0146 family protein